MTAALAAQTPPVSNLFLLRWMFGFLRPVVPLAALACLYLAVWIGLEILAVRQTAECINEIKHVQLDAKPVDAGFIAWLRSDDPRAARLWASIGLLAAFGVGLALVSYLREVTGTKLSMHKVFFIREAVYDKLQRVGQAYHDTHSTGELINRAFNDLQNIRAFVQTALLMTLEVVLIVGGYIVLLFSRSPWVAALALLPLPFWTIYILRFSRRVQGMQKEVMEAGDRNVSLLTETIAGVHVVRAFAAEPHEIARYAANCDEFFTRVMRRIRMYANFNPVVRGIATASHLTLFAAAGILVIRGTMQAGDLLMLGAAMGAILGRLQQVAMINDQYQSAIVSARRLHEVIATAPRAPEIESARDLPPGRGAVRFENVTFGYDPTKPVLHDVSFDVPDGSIVAFIGPTGAGKSTLVQLLARLYEPNAGRILIDGEDVRDLRLDSLRREVAYVFQETYLFSDTVEGNIRYGRPDAHGDRLQHAAKLAQAAEFIDDLPQGYDTRLGERGATLSGGQRQRLAIARALFTDPRILVLDDATASVDPETETAIHDAVRGALHDRTLFVISHRLSTVQRADLVIVIENGRITQTGTHDELMRRDGHYRDIAAIQLYGERLARDSDGDDPSALRRTTDQRVARELSKHARSAIDDEIESEPA